MTTLLWTGVIGHRAIWLTCGVYVFVSNGCPKFTLKGVGIMSTPMVRTEGKTIKAPPVRALRRVIDPHLHPFAHTFTLKLILIHLS